MLRRSRRFSWSGSPIARRNRRGLCPLPFAPCSASFSSAARHLVICHPLCPGSERTGSRACLQFYLLRKWKACYRPPTAPPSAGGATMRSYFCSRALVCGRAKSCRLSSVMFIGVRPRSSCAVRAAGWIHVPLLADVGEAVALIPPRGPRGKHLSAVVSPSDPATHRIDGTMLDRPHCAACPRSRWRSATTSLCCTPFSTRPRHPNDPPRCIDGRNRRSPSASLAEHHCYLRQSFVRRTSHRCSAVATQRRCPMTLREALLQYLTIRRALGTKLAEPERNTRTVRILPRT